MGHVPRQNQPRHAVGYDWVGLVLSRYTLTLTAEDRPRIAPQHSGCLCSSADASRLEIGLEGCAPDCSGPLGIVSFAD